MKQQNAIQPFRRNVLDGIRKLSVAVENAKPPDDDGDLNLRYVLRVLRDHYRTVRNAVIILTMLAFVATLFMKPVYRSQATIEIKDETPDIQSLQQLQSRDASPNNVVVTEVETEIGILKGDDLARAVVNQLHLADREKSSFSITGALGAGWKAVSGWLSGPDNNPQPGMDPKAYERLVARFEENLKVQRIGSSRLATISYESHDPRLSADAVNAVVSNYLQLHERQTDNLTAVLAKEVQDAKAELERSEAAMTDYARKHDLLYLQTENGASQNVVDQRLRHIQDDLTQAQADRYQKEALYQLVQKGDYGALPGVFDDKLLQDLTVQVANLKTQYAQLSTTFNDSYPKVKQVKNQLAAAEQVLARERNRAAATITNDYLAAVRREALLVHSYQEQKGAATAVAEKSNEYNVLKRNMDSDNQIYDSLLQKVKEASLVARIRANNVDVVDRATPQFLPVKPKILLNLALGLIAGLGLGIGLAFLQEFLDTSLKSVDEIDRLLGVPALAMIPSVQSLGELAVSGNGDHVNDNGLLLKDVFDQSALMKRESPWYRIDRQGHQKYSPLVEAFRALGSSVMLEAAGRNRALRSILVTSSQPGEGKTTVSVNLAIALSQDSRRVLLIDADLRRPSVHRALGFRNIRGLAGHLRGLNDWSTCVLPGLTPSLDVLPAGKGAQNPVALLSSSRMKTLINNALEEYDYVIVDSPALMPNLVDARILAELVDASILVVRKGTVPREFVIRARKHLSNIFGVVLNSIDARSMENYYGYQSYGSAGDNNEEPEVATYDEKIAGRQTGI